jgi:hypothetical protein
LQTHERPPLLIGARYASPLDVVHTIFLPPIDPDQPGIKESVAFSIADNEGTRVIDDVIGSELTVLLRVEICARNL